jgi:hypothetical protein
MWNSDQQFLAHQTIHIGLQQIQRNDQRTYSEPLILHAFCEQIRQSFNFFLKLGTCTYFNSFKKNPEPGLFECENFQKLRPRGYNKIQEPPNTWFRGQTRCALSLLNILKQSLRVVGWCHSAPKVSSFQGLLRGPLIW